MIDRETFDTLLCKYAKVQAISGDDILFGSGLDLSSIGFTEFLMELEELTDRDIDVDDLDASTRTAGQLYAWLNR